MGGFGREVGGIGNAGVVQSKKGVNEAPFFVGQV